MTINKQMSRERKNISFKDFSLKKMRRQLY